MSDFNDNTKEIKDQATTLYTSAKENVVDAYNKTKPEAEELVSKLSDTASDLYKSGKKKLEQGEDYIEESISSMSDSIRKHPLTSVLIAAGIGYLFAKFIK